VTGRRCGTYSAYTGGCRCDDCRAAVREYQRSKAKQRREVRQARAVVGWPQPPSHEGPTGWMDGAACRNADTRQFFPARGSGNHTDWAIAASICATCNVSAECLAYALRNRCVGVWGGTTDEQRKGMAKPCVDCGTDVGVRPAHSQRCAPCQETERRRQKYAYAREVARYREVAS
jgi:hypothetical protein